MAPFPRERCNLSPPFQVTGIDFAGAFEFGITEFEDYEGLSMLVSSVASARTLSIWNSAQTCLRQHSKPHSLVSLGGVDYPKR